MTIFDDKAADPKPEGEVVAEEVKKDAEPQSSFVAKLAEARGEKWKDPEVIAKGKLEADAYIETLESQLRQMREDIGKQDYTEKLLQQLQQKAPKSTDGNTVAPNTNNVSGTNADGNTSQSVSEDDLKSLVEKTLTEREAQATVSQNLSVVEAHLKESYGTEANAVVKKKAEELGMSLSRMEELAKESPTAFFALLGDAKKPVKPMTHGSIRTEGVANKNTGERDWGYYQQLRRENKALYYSAQTQRQMYEDKKRMGDKFGA